MNFSDLKKEKQEYIDNFEKIDKNKDGKISKSEL